MKRRDLIKGLVAVPVLGAFAAAWYKKQHYDRYLRNNILDEI
jgi:hypothetical protein